MLIENECDLRFGRAKASLTRSSQQSALGAVSPLFTAFTSPSATSSQHFVFSFLRAVIVVAEQLASPRTSVHGSEIRMAPHLLERIDS